MNRTLPTTPFHHHRQAHLHETKQRALSFLWLRFFFFLIQKYITRASSTIATLILHHWDLHIIPNKTNCFRVTQCALSSIYILRVYLLSLSHYLIFFTIAIIFSLFYFAASLIISHLIQGRSQTCIEAYIFWLFVCFCLGQNSC